MFTKNAHERKLNMAEKKEATPVKKVKKTSEESGKKKKEVTFPSPFGSHTSMVQKELTEELQKQHPQLCVLADAGGIYVTETVKLDTHMGDPNRYADEPYRKAQLDKFGVKAPTPEIEPEPAKKAAAPAKAAAKKA